MLSLYVSYVVTKNQVPSANESGGGVEGGTQSQTSTTTSRNYESLFDLKSPATLTLELSQCEVDMEDMQIHVTNSNFSKVNFCVCWNERKRRR